MQGTVPSRADAPAALLMAVLFLTFAVFTILRPDKVRAAMDNLANAWKQGSGHPYRMSLSALRVTVGAVGIAGAALFFYIAYLALAR